MQFGIALTFPAQPHSTDAAAVLGQLRLAKTVDALGFESLFLYEHHFSGYMLSPAPLNTHCFLAGITSQVRLGISAIVLPLQDPIRVVEQINLLNILAPERGIYGFAMGRGPHEFDGFGREFGNREAAFWDALKIVVAGAAGNPVKARSGRDMVIRPRADHRGTSLFGVSSRPSNLATFARMGLGAMLHFDGNIERTQSQVASYRENTVSSGRRGEVALFITALVSFDTESAIERAHYHYHLDAVAARLHYGGADADLVDSSKRRCDMTTTEKAAELTNAGVVFGSVKEFQERVALLTRSLDVDRMIFEVSYGAIDNDAAERSLQGIASALNLSPQRAM